MALPASNICGHSSLQLSLPQHATWMDSSYRSCQHHIAQQEKWKAKGMTLLFLSATALTVGKCLFQASFYALCNIAFLRNPLIPLTIKITEATTCAAFGLMQSCYLWCNATNHMDAIRENQHEMKRTENLIYTLREEIEKLTAALKTQKQSSAPPQRSLNKTLRDELNKARDTIAELKTSSSKKERRIVELQKIIDNQKAELGIQFETLQKEKEQKEYHIRKRAEAERQLSESGKNITPAVKPLGDRTGDNVPK